MTHEHQVSYRTVRNISGAQLKQHWKVKSGRHGMHLDPAAMCPTPEHKKEDPLNMFNAHTTQIL